MASIPLGNLDGLASVYFGEEWDELGETSQAVVEMFVANQGRDASRATLLEIESALSTSSEHELEDLWNSTLKSAFDVERTGMTYRQWFEHLADLLRGHLPS